MANPLTAPLPLSSGQRPSVDVALDLVIQTSRLVLRRARAGDLEAVNSFMSDVRAMRYWATSPHPTLDHSRTWLQRLMAVTGPENQDYLIELSGQVIGLAGSNPLPDFGFILHPDFWGRGLAEEASRGVIDHIFASLPIMALTAEADPRNAASLALLGRLGFLKTGEAKHTLRVGAKWVDSVYFRLDRP